MKRESDGKEREGRKEGRKTKKKCKKDGGKKEEKGVGRGKR